MICITAPRLEDATLSDVVHFDVLIKLYIPVEKQLSGQKVKAYLKERYGGQWRNYDKSMGGKKGSGRGAG